MRVLIKFALTYLVAVGATGAAEANVEQGKALFTKHCAACHGERGFATAQIEKRLGKETAMLERRKDLSDTLIKHVVRYGIRSMPWFTRVELPDDDVSAIAAYLTRDNP